MAEIPRPGRDCIAAQQEMFRLAKRDHGLSIEYIVSNSPLKLSTVKGWANGAAMPAWALGALREVGVPAYLLSLALEPYRIHIGDDESGEGAWDAAAQDAIALAAAVGQARSEAGPGRSAIVPQEEAKLADLARKAASSARRAARGN